ncbi:MAG: DNA repair protein RecN, partial [Nitrospirae bacterium]|nr:DNA repair protein RecN [Nitrospirota bacterium]
AVYEKQLSLKKHIAELIEKEKERTRRLDILRFQINEIEKADLKTEEDKELSEESKVLASAGRLTELANQAYEALYLSDSACISGISKIINSLREIGNIDVRAANAVKSAEDALPLLEEAAYFLRDYRDSLDFNPGRLDEIQERLELIKGLKRKYGAVIHDILDYGEKAVRELDELQHAGETMEALKAELENIRNILTEKALSLSKKRKAVANKIEQQVVSGLSMLSMPDTRFRIAITQDTGDDTSNSLRAYPKGVDRIEYLISPNVGEELKPLSKIASGGELSRVMLALKGILAKGDNIPVLIFDEIDAGIGGKAAETVGRKLKDLSLNHQVICITHLPQIASYADTHLKIEKSVKAKRTMVQIRKMENDERTREVARMLSGDGSDISINHAREMLKLKSDA